MNEKIQDLQNKKIAILGLGLENLALVKYILKKKVKCEITICDKREDVRAKMKNTGLRVKPAMTNTKSGMTDVSVSGGNNQRLLRRPLAARNDIKWQLGKGYNKNLEKFDILFRSPGWPVIPLAPFIKGVSSPMKLFFELCPSKNIIGVTGTKGKGTTASLIYEILKKAGKRVWLGGNIGVAPFEFLDKIKKNDWVALELSSFQLEDMTVSPHIAVITNLYLEHLAPADPNNPNFHKSLKAYRDAKLNIVKWQRSGDKAVLNYELRITNYGLNTKSKKIYFKKSELPSKLVGEHNKENIAATVEVAKIAGVKNEIIKKAVAGFKGLEHRLELACEYKGVKYYDDSFATTPESTIIALKSFASPIILFLGGADKGSDFSELAEEVKKYVHPVKSGKAGAKQFHGVKYVVLLNGDSTPRIKKELLKAGFKADNMKLAFNIKEAVKFAKAKAAPGDVVLLSTACASFGMFKNYKERGNLFKAEVNSWKK